MVIVNPQINCRKFNVEYVDLIQTWPLCIEYYIIQMTACDNLTDAHPFCHILLIDLLNLPDLFVLHHSRYRQFACSGFSRVLQPYSWLVQSLTNFKNFHCSDSTQQFFYKPNFLSTQKSCVAINFHIYLFQRLNYKQPVTTWYRPFASWSDSCLITD